MQCPKCEGKSLVIDSRKMGPGKIYRRRFCQSLECGHRWNTWESALQIARPEEIKARLRGVSVEMANLAKLLLEVSASVE